MYYTLFDRIPNNQDSYTMFDMYDPWFQNPNYEVDWRCYEGLFSGNISQLKACGYQTEVPVYETIITPLPEPTPVPVPVPVSEPGDFYGLLIILALVAVNLAARKR